MYHTFLKRFFGCPQDYFTIASASVFKVLIQRYINFYYKACFLNWLWKEKNTDQNKTAPPTIESGQDADWVHHQRNRRIQLESSSVTCRSCKAQLYLVQDLRFKIMAPASDKKGRLWEDLQYIALQHRSHVSVLLQFYVTTIDFNISFQISIHTFLSSDMPHSNILSNIGAHLGLLLLYVYV